MSHRLDKKIFADRLRKARKKKYKSQEKFADDLPVSPNRKSETGTKARQTVNAWEKGTRLPDLENLLEISELLDVDIDYLTGRIDHKKHSNAFICQATGLSEDAVEILCNLHSAPDQDHAPERKLVIDTINALLENTVNQEMIEENGLFTSPVYQIGEYIGLTSPPTISGQDKVFIKFNVGDDSVSNLESVRELYAERTLRLITRGLDKLKEIIASKKRGR